LPLSERKRDLNRLCRKADVPFMRQVETFLDGAALFAHSTEFDLEGVISKRIDQPYVTGPAKYCVKSKSPTWRRDNQQRFRMFEGNKKKPALTEEQKTLIKKREELTRVRERLQDPDLRPGIGRASCASTSPSWSGKSPNWSRARSGRGLNRPLQKI
jgi:hypothetical protein